MRFRQVSAWVSAALIAATLPLTASAEGISLGANIGSARVNGGDFEGSDTGWKAHIGSSYHQVFGGEIGYVDFGDLGGNGPKARAWAPAVTLGVPIGMASLYAKGGVAFADVDSTPISQEYKNNDPFYGVGLRIGMTHNPRGASLGFRAEYERYNFSQHDLNQAQRIDMAQAGLELLFGN